MSRLVRVTRTVNDRGLMVDESEVKDIVTLDTPYYQSLYYYPEDAAEYFKENKRIKGYKGDVFSPYIVFDIDSKDLEVSKYNTIVLIDWLKDRGLYSEYAAKIAFSGSKGFHLTINTDYTFKAKELKTFCTYISSQIPFKYEADFKIDPSIYNTNRQFRVVNTIHGKSSLYKIEMVEAELRKCSMDTIKEAASKPQATYPFEASIKEDLILEILDSVAKVKAAEKKSRKKVIKTFIGAEIPKKQCIQIIQEGDMQDGESNAGLLRLAAFYQKQGLSVDETRVKLTEAAKNRREKYPHTNEISDEKIDHEILDCVYGSADGYNFNCEDWFLKLKCQGACEELIVKTPKFKPTPVKSTPIKTGGFNQHVKTPKEVNYMEASGFKTIKQSSKSYKTFAEDWKTYRVMTGVQELDSVVRMLPTGLVIVNAKPGVGKTTIALNIMKNCSEKDKNVLFYSIDMVEDEFFTKAKSKALKLSPDEVMDLYFNGDEESRQLQEEGDIITEEMLKNVYINYDSGITPEKIDKDLEAFSKEGIKIDLVIIDYIQKMEGCGDFTSPRIGQTLMGLKKLQPKHKVCVIGLSQIPRSGGNEETPIRTASAAKGGSVYEENASIVINLWRPMKFAGTDDDGKSMDTVLGYMVAKNRMGECQEGVLHFNGATSDVRNMTDEEREEYLINKEARRQAESSEVKYAFK